MKDNKYSSPPEFLLSLLKLFCSPKYLQEITGDVEELFLLRQEKYSYFLNVLLLFIDIVKFCRPTFWRFNYFSLSGGLIMLSNNIKFAFRNFIKHRFNSAINVIGLTISITCILYICSYIYYELSFDKHIKDSDQIHRLTTDASFMEKIIKTTKASTISGKILYDRVPEIKEFTQISPYKSATLSYNGKIINEEKTCSGDSSFAKIFNPVVHFGDFSEALKNPDEIIISQSLSSKFFDSENPVGKKLRMNSGKYFTIAGVFGDFPANTHFKPNLLFTRDYHPQSDWANDNVVIYLKLEPECNIAQVQKKIDRVNESYLMKDFAKYGIDANSFKQNKNYYTLKLQPFNDIHLHSNLADEYEPNSDIQYVYIFQIIGIFILVIASINFINLSTARTTLRAKEVGIKKVMGSSRKELVVQFLLESVITSLISFILALIIFSFGFELFNSFLGLSFNNLLFSEYNLLLAILLIIILVGFIAGSFPAFVLSSFSPIKALKNNLKLSSKSILRNGLVTLQLVISMILIVSTFIVFQQIDYIQNKSLGFEKEQTIIFENTNGPSSTIQLLKEKLLEHKNVVNATVTNFIPTSKNRHTSVFFPDGNVNDSRTLIQQLWAIDFDYIETLGIKLVKGRNFNKAFGTDSSSIIINEACAKHFGFDNPFNHTLSRVGDNDKLVHYKIIGIVNDFHFESFKEVIRPLVLMPKVNNRNIAIKINGNPEEVLNHAKMHWHDIIPHKVFNYKFLDEQFAHLYDSELRVGKLMSIFALLAIIIAALGLLGLVTFSIERKTKEIGIRKVMGANTFSIFHLLTKDYFILILCSILVSLPLSYYVIQLWISGYAYKTDFSFWAFLLSGTICTSIVLIIILFQTLKTSSINPIEIIKYE
ncbi:MAG: ABC transporter permease [Rhodothermaceae bacterium]